MESFATRYQLFIAWISESTGLADTVLHIHAGLAVLVLARLLTRRSLGTFVPLSVVVAAEALNELMDRISYREWRWADTFYDFAHTLFWPLVICLAVRLRPLIVARREGSSDTP